MAKANYDKITKIGEEMQKKGYYVQGDRFEKVDKEGHILDTIPNYEAPLKWRQFASTVCGCGQRHKEKQVCAVCGKKDYTLCYYWANKEHLCLKDAADAAPKHMAMMEKKYGINLDPQEAQREIAKTIDKINQNPLMRIAKVIFGRD